MKKLSELRMSLIVLLIGIFLLSGCLFNSNVTVTFKTNGGTNLSDIKLSSGSTIEEIPTPKKDGYVFDGWYLDGEEFDLNSKISENITLVAKWKKVKVESTEPTPEEETTTTTTEVVTTKTKKVVNKTKEVKKEESTTTIKEEETTTTATAKNSTTSTTKIISTKPATTEVITTPVIPEPTPEEPTVPITPVVPEEDKYWSLNYDSEENKYTIEIVNEENTNIVSRITRSDYDELIGSTEYTVEDNNGNIYEGMNEFYSLDEITTFYIYNDTIQVVLTKNVVDASWELDYAKVKLAKSLHDHYYDSLAKALEYAGDNDEITLLTDISTDTIELTKLITLNGANHKLILTKEDEDAETKYLFNIKYNGESEESITFKDIELDASKDSAFIIDTESTIKSIKILNTIVRYKNTLIEGDEDILVIDDERNIYSTLT